MKRWRRRHRRRRQLSPPPPPQPGELYGWRLQLAFWGLFFALMGWAALNQWWFG